MFLKSCILLTARHVLCWRFRTFSTNHLYISPYCLCTLSNALSFFPTLLNKGSCNGASEKSRTFSNWMRPGRVAWCWWARWELRRLDYWFYPCSVNDAIPVKIFLWNTLPWSACRERNSISQPLLPESMRSSLLLHFLFWHNTGWTLEGFLGFLSQVITMKYKNNTRELLWNISSSVYCKFVAEATYCFSEQIDPPNLNQPLVNQKFLPMQMIL
jgi:hypothetical protein